MSTGGKLSVTVSLVLYIVAQCLPMLRASSIEWRIPCQCSRNPLPMNDGISDSCGNVTGLTHQQILSIPVSVVHQGMFGND